jgi:hypothetical protein
LAGSCPYVNSTYVRRNRLAAASAAGATSGRADVETCPLGGEVLFAELRVGRRRRWGVEMARGADAATLFPDNGEVVGVLAGDAMLLLARVADLCLG